MSISRGRVSSKPKATTRAELRKASTVHIGIDEGVGLVKGEVICPWPVMLC